MPRSAKRFRRTASFAALLSVMSGFNSSHIQRMMGSMMNAEQAHGIILAAGILGIICAMLDPLAGQAGSIAPPQLFGKSVIVSWSEARMRRTAGEEQFHAQNVSLTESIYISTAGRPFERRAYPRSGVQREHVGATGQSPTGNARILQFQGRSIAMTSERINGAMRIEINFDENFGSCTARVVNGKVPGGGAYTVHSLKDRATPVEIQSALINAGPTCSIKDGNVFAD